jgi:phosphate transport system permease protein
MCSSSVCADIHGEHGGGTGSPTSPETIRPAVGYAAGAKQFWRRGEPQVWATAAALTIMLSLVFVVLAVVMVQGLGVFWPKQVIEVILADGRKILGEQIRAETNPDTHETSLQFKTGNRERDPQRQDFQWVKQDDISEMHCPPEVFVFERVENGNFYGHLERVDGPDVSDVRGDSPAERLADARGRIRQKIAEEAEPIAASLATLGRDLQRANNELVRLRHLQKKSGGAADGSPPQRIETLRAECDRIKQESDALVSWQQEYLAQVRRNVAVVRDAAGNETPIALADIVRCYQPNAMGVLAKCRHYAAKIGELLWANPRESNTEGGLFPAIFGTVMLIFVMAVTCFPLGVLAGIYLGEYAKEGFLVRVVRIAVNNLAGIPSIVYGIFGLGFFVYGIGGLIDSTFFPDLAAEGTPTFGTGGILWASLTLGLLTVPVVIVSTEEALRAIPRSVREGSLALGATKFQTLVRVLLPMASPGMMTGFILAMARAAGEVAPLMITGVVKLAPQLPLDSQFPFFHLDRKFMHLGFHIYDIGFQSPNVEASKPMVFVTTLLLLLIVLAMTSTAIVLRNRMRKRYQVRTI